MTRIFNITVTPREELPFPYNQRCEEIVSVVIGPFEWEHKTYVGGVHHWPSREGWLTIRHPDGNYDPPNAHTVIMLDALVRAQIQGEAEFAAADRAMGDASP